MRFLLPGSIHGGLVAALRDAGHEVWDRQDGDWWKYYENGKSPEDWADAVAHAVVVFKPDVFVLMKGFHGGWYVPERLLYWVRQRVRTMAFACADDPAVTPLLLEARIPALFDIWLTSCVGITQLFGVRATTRARVIEWPPGYDQRIGEIPDAPELAVGCAITGSPYPGPWPAPHFTGGWTRPRRDYIHALLAEGVDVGIWGPRDWLDSDKGGDPAFEPIYRGWLHQDQIHRVHRNAKTNLATQLVQGYRYFSERIQTVGGAGGVLVHEDRPGLRDEVGDAVAWFQPGAVSEAVDTVKRLLNDQPESDRMREKLHGIVMNRHLWTHRAQTLVRAVIEARQ